MPSALDKPHLKLKHSKFRYFLVSFSQCRMAIEINQKLIQSCLVPRKAKAKNRKYVQKLKNGSFRFILVPVSQLWMIIKIKQKYAWNQKHVFSTASFAPR